jgi:cell wall-associated NlpC family hydrolase
MRPTSSRWIVLALLLSLVLAVPFLLGSAAASVARKARESSADRAQRAAVHRVQLRWLAVQHAVAQQRRARRLAAFHAALTGVRAVAIARRFIGVPYRYGGFSPGTGFDCSGFVRFVYGKLGIALPHNAAAQFGLGRVVPRSALRPGDLVFFSGLGHVGIYVGNGRFIHAPETGERVSIAPLSGNWSSDYVGARRVT